MSDAGQTIFDTTVYSFLDAVNLLITSIGSDPVTSDDPSLDSDVAIAVGFLVNTNNDIQSRGWGWNTLEKVTLAQATDGTIPVPSDALEVVYAYWSDTGAPMQFIQRNGKLYDRVNNTFVFTSQVQADLIIRLDWNDLPQQAKRLIAIVACQQFQAVKQGSGMVAQVEDRDIQRAWAALENLEDRIRRSNQITGNLSTMRVLYGSGVRRNRGVF